MRKGGKGLGTFRKQSGREISPRGWSRTFPSLTLDFCPLSEDPGKEDSSRASRRQRLSQTPADA